MLRKALDVEFYVLYLFFVRSMFRMNHGDRNGKEKSNSGTNSFYES